MRIPWLAECAEHAMRRAQLAWLSHHRRRSLRVVPFSRSISPSIARSTEKWIERRQMLVRRVDETREHATWQDSEFDRRVEEAKRRLSSPRGAPVPNLAKLHPWESARVTMPAPAVRNRADPLR